MEVERSQAVTAAAAPRDDALAQLRGMERSLLAALAQSPLESLTLLVGGGAAVFYWAESGVNPEVRDYWDAVHYIATSLSVGYAKIFPVTPVGKIVGALVMMVGPSLSGHLLDPVQGPAPADPALLAKLDELLAELRRIGTGATAGRAESPAGAPEPAAAAPATTASSTGAASPTRGA